ncbi:MAG: hypothetical protein QM733_12605 [Ilumatobacteraceae bacterium]
MPGTPVGLGGAVTVVDGSIGWGGEVTVDAGATVVGADHTADPLGDESAIDELAVVPPDPALLQPASVTASTPSTEHRSWCRLARVRVVISRRA